MIPPQRLQSVTGFLHSEAKRTSSIIWPMESSTLMNALTLSAAAAMGALGNGHTVMGRISPALMPSLH